MPYRNNKKQWADSSGRRHLAVLSIVINLCLFAAVNALLVALVHTDSHADPNVSAADTIRVFIWANAIAAFVTAIIAPFVLSAFERMQHRLSRQNKELRSL